MANFDIGEIFGIPDAKGFTVEGGDDPNHPNIPASIDGYVFRQELVSDFFAWEKALAGVDGLYLIGPTGCGKSTLITQVFNRLNRPLIKIEGNPDVEFLDLVSSRDFVDGDTITVDGPLTQAMRYGVPVLIDEVDKFDPSTSSAIQKAVEDDPQVTVIENGNEVVKAKDGFKVIATGNSAGKGDSTGLYAGVNRQNEATLDRFMVTQVGYPTKDQERPILESVASSLPEWIREAMLDVAAEIRALYQGEAEGPQIEMPLSTRSLCRWAILCSAFQGMAADPEKNPVIHSVNRAFLFRAEPETQEAVKQLIHRVFGDPSNVGS